MQTCPRGIKRRDEINERWTESCLLDTADSRDFSSEICTSVTFDKAVVITSFKRVFFSLGNWLLNNLYVAKQVGRAGIGLRKLAVKPDGVISWELWEFAGNYKTDRTG